MFRNGLMILFFMLILLLAGCESVADTKGVSNLPDAPPKKAQKSEETTKPILSTVKAEVHSNAQSLEFLQHASFINVNHGWVTAGHLILHTSDGGEHWQEIVKIDSDIKDIQFVSPTKGWMVTTEGILQTNDAGEHWLNIRVPELKEMMQLDFLDAEHGWISGISQDGKTKLMYTKDGGNKWGEITYPPSLDDYCPNFNFHFISNSEGWLVCGGEPGAGQQLKSLYKTSDGGKRWDLLGEKGKLAVGGYVEDLYFMDKQYGWLTTARGGLYSTHDGGKTWGFLKGNPNGSGTNDPILFKEGSGYVLEWGRLIATDDGGETWREVLPRQKPSLVPIFFNENDGISAVTHLDSLAILKTHDGGRTWEKTSSIPSDILGESITAFSFSDQQHGWVITGNVTATVWKTDDGGRSWERIAQTNQSKEFYYGLSMIDDQSGYIASGWGHLTWTGDGGKTFEVVDSQDSRSRSYHFIDKMTSWKIDNFGLFETHDGGNKWSKVATPENTRVFQYQFMPDQEEAWLIAAVRNDSKDRYVSQLYHTLDHGKHWVHCEMDDIEPSAVQFIDQQHGWLYEGSQSAPYVTDDGGRTWVQISYLSDLNYPENYS